MNRTANDGMKYLANIDTLPLLGGKDTGAGGGRSNHVDISMPPYFSVESWT